VGFVVDKVALGQVFSEYFNFPCQLAFHRLLHNHHHHHLTSRAATIGQTAAPLPSGLSHPTRKKNNAKTRFMIFTQISVISLFYQYQRQ
jgi:hypothetical protein